MIQKDFLNLRHQTIKIQCPVCWRLEKAILRWRLKRKAFCVLQVNPDEVLNSPK
jgi:hypothetical protein